MNPTVRLLLLPLIGLLCCASAYYQIGNYVIDEAYVVRFDGRGAAGTFRGLAGTLRFDPAQPASAVIDVTVDARTIATGNETKDRHARGEAWFDVDRYPDISFKSTKVRASGEAYVATGELTLHGTRKEIELPFTFSPAATGGGTFRGQFTVDRTDYGIDGPWLSFTVASELQISLEVPVFSPRN